MSEDIKITFVIKKDDSAFGDEGYISHDSEYIDNTPEAITEAVQEFKNDFSDLKYFDLGYSLDNSEEITWVQIGKK